MFGRGGREGGGDGGGRARLEVGGGRWEVGGGGRGQVGWMAGTGDEGRDR